jgi:hypothetical protein
MSLPVVLRPEASRDAEEARDHLDRLRFISFHFISCQRFRFRGCEGG